MKLLPTKGNWGLKILSLILAIVIYYAIRGAIRDAPSLITKGEAANAAATR